VRDLEDRYASGAGHDTAGLARLEQQITDVSLRFGVLCRFTAFVAVDSRVVTDGAGPHRVTQPVELPAGWELAGLGHPAAGGWVAASAPAAGGWAATGPVAASPMAVPMASRPAMPMRARSGHSRESRKAVTAAARSASRGAPTEVSATGETSRLAQARRQAADEAAALRATQGAADTERAQLLADLATRIEALLAALTADPIATGLGDLARKLHACDGPGSPGGARLEALWQEAIHVLTDFAGDASPPASRAFWKRS
jgi:Ca-activated chloride channel family protein